jgi:flavin reductase (DIM6/NTAB) family NADH-FMN oxidoreductase RutF
MKKSIGPKTVLHPAPTLIVCTYDSAGKPNAMAVAWGGICCSKPPAVAVSIREATYSHAAIIERKAFTVNIPSEKYAREADYFGSVSGCDEDKFKTTGLTPIQSDLVDAPYIEEFPLILECKLIHTHELGLHTQFIGEIMDVKADEDTLDDKGHPMITKTKPVLFSASDREYFKVGGSLGKGWEIGKAFME